MHLRILRFFGLLLAASLSGIAQPSDAGIQKFLDAWATARNAHEVAGIMRLHADDCVAVNRFGKLLVGKEATRQQMEHLHREVFNNSQFPALHVLHQRSLSPELVVLQAA